jgi:hypothetical protein
MPALRGPAIVLSILAALCAFSLLIRVFRTQRPTLRIVLPLVMLWFSVIGTLAMRGFFADFTSLPPHLLLALLLPAVAFAIFSVSSKAIPEGLGEMPVYWLIAFQTFRVVVEIVLFRGYKAGAIPVQMTFYGRNFDILVGLTAPLAAWLSSKLYARNRSIAFGIVWNIAGLISVMNIAIVAVLSMPTPLRYFMNDPPNTLLAYFPFIYLPAVLVPAAYIAHLLSIRQLLQKRVAQSDTDRYR